MKKFILSNEKAKKIDQIEYTSSNKACIGFNKLLVSNFLLLYYFSKILISFFLLLIL